MNLALIWLALILVGSIAAVNLIVTLRILKTVKRNSRMLMPAQNIEVDQPVPNFKTTKLLDQSTLSSQDLLGYPIILIYLDVEDEHSKQAIKEIENLQYGLELADVILLLVATDAENKIRKLLKQSNLLHQVVEFDHATYNTLNPDHATCFYQFIDPDGNLQAKGSIGDTHWLNFVDQIEEVMDMARTEQH